MVGGEKMNWLMISKIVQIFISIFLILLVVIQNKSSGLSGAFGGMGPYRSRRGVEKLVFYLTIMSALLLVGNSLLILFLG